MSRRAVIGLASACAALAGCAATASTPHPPTTSTPHPATASTPHPPTTKTSPLAQAQASHEYRSSAPPAEAVAGGASTAEQAIRAFADAYVNWSAPTVSAQMRALAARSVGQARSAVSLAATQTAQDYELQRGGIANRGTVEAVVPLHGARNRYLVVTRERTSATNTTVYQGLRPAWHVALATVTELSPGRWVLNAWQPES
ncbi:MAG: hypothetical protein ACR2OB_02240 [Solirubrobacteraceae bacterium]